MSITKPPHSLNSLREALRETQRTTDIEVRVGMGTCSIAVGAREVLNAILDAVDRHGVTARVTTTGCQGFCSEEPLIQVLRPGEGAVTYRGMTPKRAAEVVEHHVVGGHPIGKWVLAKSEPTRHQQKQSNSILNHI